jgi:hypothetical protein
VKGKGSDAGCVINAARFDARCVTNAALQCSMPLRHSLCGCEKLVTLKGIGFQSTVETVSTAIVLSCAVDDSAPLCLTSRWRARRVTRPSCPTRWSSASRVRKMLRCLQLEQWRNGAVDHGDRQTRARWEVR